MNTLIAAIRDEMEWIRGLPIPTPGATRRLLALRDVLQSEGVGDVRYFIDVLTTTGDAYLIPSTRRAEWQAFDVHCEETCEQLPVPEWARPIAAMSHVEFEMPEEIFK